jgi:hypothetical protein
MARAAIKCPRDLSDEIIAGRIIELAKVGERNVEVLSEAALNVPAGAVSAPNPPPVPALPPSIPDSSSWANRASGAVLAGDDTKAVVLHLVQP